MISHNKFNQKEGVLMGPGGAPPPGGPGGYKYEKVPKPQNLKDVPRYLRELLGGFFYRLFYTFVLVWQTDPLILFTMLFISVFDGVTPIIGSLITARITNEMQQLTSDRAIAEASGVPYELQFVGSVLLGLLIGLFAFRLLNRVVSRISNSIIRIAGQKVVKQVKVQIMEKAKTLDLASFDMPGFYEKLENANREAGTRPIQTLQSTFSVVSTVISLVGYLVILAQIPDMWWIPILIAGVSLPSAIINFYYRRKNFKYMRHRSKDRRQMNYYSDLLVNKDMAKEIRIFNLSDTFIDRYKEVFARYFAGLKSLIVRESFWLVISAVVSCAANCLCYALIARGVFDGRFKIGDYSLYTGALTSIATCVSSFISTSATIYEGTLFIDNLVSFMKEKQTVIPSVDPPQSVSHGTSHTIEFENVSFAYPGTERKVIKNINLKLRPGETVVLVGLNGAGKTTLIKLLTRLYDPTEGRILLDGRDIREYDTHELYNIFGIIFQDFGKYAVSVSENISFGNIDAEPDPLRIRESARQSSAAEYINALPRDYDTPLMRFFEEDGIELSGGQWQKLAIARAFYRESDILILDEPTASLDPMAEQEIFNTFDRLREGKTTIFVSHRLSSAVIASKIIVLRNGEVIEEGDHRELMALHGEYFKLFTTQAQRYIDNADDRAASGNDAAMGGGHGHDRERGHGNMPNHRRGRPNMGGNGDDRDMRGDIDIGREFSMPNGGDI